VYSSENGLTVGCESRIEYFGLCSAAFGLHGATSWLSSNQKPWSPGIALAFVCSGASGQSQRPLAGESSMPRFELSSGGWRRRIPPGALLGFMVNFSNSASTSPERTVSRYIRRLSPPEQARKLWATFLRNHREVITAMDFFTVPTLTFRVLYCFFIIEHDRRKILHFNVTEHPPLDSAATERSISGILSVPLRDPGW
jgi:hypothetical protein